MEALGKFVKTNPLTMKEFVAGVVGELSDRNVVISRCILQAIWENTRCKEDIIGQSLIGNKILPFFCLDIEKSYGLVGEVIVSALEGRKKVRQVCTRFLIAGKIDESRIKEVGEIAHDLH